MSKEVPMASVAATGAVSPAGAVFSQTAAAVFIEQCSSIAKPLHVQRIEKSLQLEPLLNYVEGILKQSQQSDLETTDTETDLEAATDCVADYDTRNLYNGVVISKTERKSDKSRLYNFSKVKRSRRWLKSILLSDTSSDDDDSEQLISTQDLQDMLRMNKYQSDCRQQFYEDTQMQQYQYYSVGLLSNYDKFYEHQKMIVGPKKKLCKEQRRLEKRLLKAKLKKKMKDKVVVRRVGSDDEEGESGQFWGRAPANSKPSKVKKLTSEQIAARRRKIWTMIAKKDIPKAQKQKVAARKEILSSLKKVSKECQKECRRAALQSQKLSKDAVIRARRLSKEMNLYWKRFDKVEKEHRKRAEKEAIEQRKMDVELREMRRQQRKLNFLITQTELYAHFMSKKKMVGNNDDSERDAILGQLDDPSTQARLAVTGGRLTDNGADQYDSELAKNQVLRNAESAYQMHAMRQQSYDVRAASTKTSEMSFANPSISGDIEYPQPSMFEGKLKGYQLKGMNWLASLYNQGINGILADEMGLGKTVQSVSLLAHLAEAQSIWGPFLIVAPASTLHNWQQEISRFVPKFKVVPYWGNTQDRRVLRKFWNQEQLHTRRDASFHIVVTSYQLIIQDVKYFQRIKWHYMVLDEAQAIKSTASARWKILLGFNCRNRLLLTGTPIQNTMAELWALLHFIMPTLFDCHDEFNEWFSKDIESFAEKHSGLDENQLSRLHMILKPFMLRRVKKDVENELSDKIQILVYCPLTMRQRLLYQAVKKKISIEDLLQSSSTNPTQAQFSTSSLMNLVMQFRKVCNHPELFERREGKSPLYMQSDTFILPKLVYRQGMVSDCEASKAHIVFNRFYIHNQTHVHHSLFRQKHAGQCHHTVDSAFSFTRFINMSPAQLQAVMLNGLLVRWLSVFVALKEAYRIHHAAMMQQHNSKFNYLSRTGLLLHPTHTLSPPNLRASRNLSSLVFIHPTSTIYSHADHSIHCMPETASHRRLRSRKGDTDDGCVRGGGRRKAGGSGVLPVSPKRTPLSPNQQKYHIEEPVHKHIPRQPRTLKDQPTDMPAFLYNTAPKVHAPSLQLYCCDRSHAWTTLSARLCATKEAYLSLLHGTPENAEYARYARQYFAVWPSAGLAANTPAHGFSRVVIPNKETLVTDAGKLSVLDGLLCRLKSEDHRVLIYSQMTRMIDILEDYMHHRKHTYMRLDGSSKISERRDMVADFQTRSDIFVFLLSTRAGGLGINLTAADTVIFYDSDWNPTVDQQAMDRAHRLGQTKQVTVYRLICKGSIEERILQRAKEKSEIQRMVISGGDFRPDVLKPKEVVSLLLDDDEMENKLKNRQSERRGKDDSSKEKERKRKQYQTKRTGRGPGRPKKKKDEDEGVIQNMTVAAPDTELNLSLDSSVPASPQSVMSMGSESASQSVTMADDSSNDALVIVDETNLPPSAATVTPPTSGRKRSSGRPRGRPRRSSTPRGGGSSRRGRGGVQKTLIAADLAAENAGKAAAYAAHGYSFIGKQTESSLPAATSTPSTSRPASPLSFYTPRTTPNKR